MMTFHLHLKKISKPKHTILKFDLEKLKDPYVLETFQAMIRRKQQQQKEKKLHLYTNFVNTCGGFSSRARIRGECLTIHSLPAFFFFFSEDLLTHTNSTF